MVTVANVVQRTATKTWGKKRSNQELKLRPYSSPRVLLKVVDLDWGNRPTRAVVELDQLLFSIQEAG